MANPMNKLSTQRDMPVTTVSQHSYEEQQKAIDEAFKPTGAAAMFKEGHEVAPPAGFEQATNEADAVANEQANAKSSEPAKPAPVVQSVALSQDELDEITGRDILKLAPTVAQNLRPMEFLAPRCKDKSKEFRWVQFKAQGGAYYQKALAFGFRNAQLEDVEGSVSDEIMYDKQEKVIKYFDTILMIIPKIKLRSKYAENFQRSIGMVQNANKSARNVGAAEYTKDVANYVPGDKEDFRRGDASKVAFYVPDASTVAKQTK